MTTVTEIVPNGATVNSGSWRIANGVGGYVAPASGLSFLYDSDATNTFLENVPVGGGSPAAGVITFDFADASIGSGEIIDGVALYTHGNASNVASHKVKATTLGNVVYPSNFASGGWVGDYGPGHLVPGLASTNWNSYINTLQVEITVPATGVSWRTIKARYTKYARPTVTMTGPTEGATITNTSRPTISWTFAGDTRPQYTYQVRVFTAAQYGIGGFNPATSPATWDSGNMVSSSGAIQITADLVDGVTYRAYVRAAQALPASGYVHYHTEGGVAWPFRTFTIDLALPPTPTTILPIAASTVNHNVPTLSMTMPAPTIVGSLIRGQWQLATDAGFTANLKTVTDPTTEARGTAAVTTETLTESNKLHQALWYIRGRILDNYGQSGAWSASHSFTVSHAPGRPTPLGPLEDTAVPVETTNKVMLSWQFNDTALPYDGQTAYETKVYGDNFVYSSGKQTSTNKFHEVTINDADEANEVSWEVRVWDADDVVSQWSSQVSGTHTFIYIERPVANITFPTGVVTEPSPVITWTQNGSTYNGSANFFDVKKFKLTIYKGAVLPENFAWTTGWVGSNNSSYNTSPTSFNLAGQFAFINNETYNIVLEVSNAWNMQSLADTQAITTDWIGPDKPAESVSPTAYVEDGYVSISWNNAAEDDEWTSYGVYRREEGQTEWTLISEVTTPDTNYLVRDYLAGSGLDLEYSVVQRANRFAVTVESDYEPFDSVAVPTSGYWLVHPTDETKSIRLASVRDESFTEEYEQAVHNVIGVGRRVEFGTRWGFSGSLEAQLYDANGMTARQQRQLIESLKAEQIHLYLRNPFGDVWKVAVSDISVKRIPGVGQNEYVTVTLPYQEVG